MIIYMRGGKTMKKLKDIKRLSRHLFELENEREKYHSDLVSDPENKEILQKFSDVSDEIEMLRDDIRLTKGELQE